MTSLKRVNSQSSELNDFTETDDGKKIYNVSQSRLIRITNWFHVIAVYFPFVFMAIVAYVVFKLIYLVATHKTEVSAFLSTEKVELQKPLVMEVGYYAIAFLVLLVLYLLRREKGVYLVDFTTFTPPESWRITQEQFVHLMKAQGFFNEESIAFMERMVKQSGTGPATAWPPGIIRCLEGLPVNEDIEASRRESETVIFDIVRRLLTSTGTKAREVDFLVINCSLFSPTPSLCAMVINEFGMRPDVSSYNLSGMGCSASLISLELVKNCLAGRPNSVALMISTEIITPNLYHGNERGFLLQNTLFRCGGAACLITNRWRDALRARFKLLHVVRTHYVGEGSYGCVYETQDDTPDRYRGVRLSKDIVKIAGRAMEKNLTDLGPRVLPISEQLKTGWSMLYRMIAKQLKWGKVDAYIPDFKRAVDHFCIHAGGRGVIDGIEQALKLNPKHVEPSRHTLYTYGNTSSSSVWYEMDYIRNHMDLQRGERILQLAFGSGFKCNSAVWVCLRPGPGVATKLEEDKKND